MEITTEDALLEVLKGMEVRSKKENDDIVSLLTTKENAMTTESKPLVFTKNRTIEKRTDYIKCKSLHNFKNFEFIGFSIVDFNPIYKYNGEDFDKDIKLCKYSKNISYIEISNKYVETNAEYYPTDYDYVIKTDNEIKHNEFSLIMFSKKDQKPIYAYMSDNFNEDTKNINYALVNQDDIY